MVGFDLDDIAWDAEEFSTQRDFLLNVIDLALRRHRWDALSYEPALVTGQLRQLRELVAHYEPARGHQPASWQWRTPPDQLVTCAKHRVFMHAHGCLLCHDGE